MTFKEVSRLLAKTYPAIVDPSTQQRIEYFDKFRGLPFWIWNLEEHKAAAIQASLRFGNKYQCCFNHFIGLPEKPTGIQRPIYPFQKEIVDALDKHKHVWIKKSSGSGVSELLLRYITWCCLKDDKLTNSQILILTGPRLDLSVSLIDRMKGLFVNAPFINFTDKETVLTLGRNADIIRIEAMPSHHLSSARGLPRVSFILLDEADYFSIGDQQEARVTSERYIGKSDPHIVMISTPGQPGGLFSQIEAEPAETCLYHRIFIPYTKALGTLYSEQDIISAKASSSFEREYNLKYSSGANSLFRQEDIDATVERGKLYDPDPDVEPINLFSLKCMGIDVGYSSSNSAITILELVNVMVNSKTGEMQDQIRVLYSKEFERVAMDDLVQTVMELISKYHMESESAKIYIDGSAVSLIRQLKLTSPISEDGDYMRVIEYARQNKFNIQNMMKVIPLQFSTMHKQLLIHSKVLIEGGYLAINPKFDRLIISLRTAIEEEASLKKDAMTFSDSYDSLRIAMHNYKMG